MYTLLRGVGLCIHTKVQFLFGFLDSLLAFVILGSKDYIENFTLMSQVRKSGTAKANTTGTVLKV